MRLTRASPPSLSLLPAILLLFTACADANGRHGIDGKVIPSLATQELAVTDSGHLGDVPASIEYWANKPTGARGPPPYPYPTDRKYNTGGGPVPGKINVHLVPHSHDDTGWQVTVDQYFAQEVYFIIDTVVQNLAQDPNRKFIYVETGFFARWWEQASDAKRELARALVKRKQLEFINGGWCMHDEGSPLWTAMVDQTTRGHQFLLKTFGPEANPRGTWQIDPFGHSNTQAWLLGAEAGFESLYWGRMDWQDRQMRFNKQQGNDGFEWIWQGSESLGASAQIFAGDLFGTGQGGYSTWINFNEAKEQVNDDPARHDYNVDMWVDKFVQNARTQANHTLSEHQMWACGTDFQYQNADHWYRNLDKLIHYVNLNGSVNAFYSTPSLYTDEKKRWKGAYPVRTDDVFPLGDDAHNYWSGYFTSRPALKRQVRFATNLLVAARQLELVANVSAADVGLPTAHREPPVGTSWTDALEGTVGIATHHDGMSGTERQDVTDDYEMRISESSVEVEAGVSLALGRLLGLPASAIAHCNCNAAADCLNISVCAATTGKSGFTVAAWNPLAHPVQSVVRLPVSAGIWRVVDGAGAALPVQIVDLDQRTHELPLLYLNSHGMNQTQIDAERKRLANKADSLLVFSMPLPPLGLATFRASVVTDSERKPDVIATDPNADADADGNPNAKANANANPDAHAHAHAHTDAGGAAPPGASTVSNDVYTVEFDRGSGLVTAITNRRSGASTPLSISWGWYNSSVGGCTAYPADVPPHLRSPPCSPQASGAYIFRPNSSTLFYPGPPRTPSIELVPGAVCSELRQTFSAWATHVIRLCRGSPFVELEWTAGPIPVETPWFEPVASHHGKPLPNRWGKELVLKYASGLHSDGTFYTDSNGKEMVRRVYNKRGPSYPHQYNISEPVAGNYYPVNALIAVDDGKHELSVITDASQAGTSLADGEIELMVHRRLQRDDNRGVQEPLNETMCGCNDINALPGKMGAHGHEGDGGCECEGLTVRGRHWIVFDELVEARRLRRLLSEELNFPPLLGFAPPHPPGRAEPRPSFSAVAKALPPNVKLVTLTNTYAEHNGGKWLLRLSHLYSVGEHPTLATPVTLNLRAVFAKAGLRITSATETSLTGNRQIAEVDKLKHKWNTHAASAAEAERIAQVDKLSYPQRVPLAFPKLTIRPMEVRTFLATFE